MSDYNDQNDMNSTENNQNSEQPGYEPSQGNQPQYQQPQYQQQYQQPQYQQQYQQPQYYNHMNNQKNNSGMAIGSMILGIISLVLMCAPFLSPILAVVGLVLGIVSLKSGRSGKGMAIAGIVMCSIATVVGIIIIINYNAIIQIMYEIAEEMENYNSYY